MLYIKSNSSGCIVRLQISQLASLKCSISLWCEGNNLAKKSRIPEAGGGSKAIRLKVIGFIKTSNSHKPLLLAFVTAASQSIKCSPVNSRESLPYDVNEDIICLQVLSNFDSILFLVNKHFCNRRNSCLIYGRVISQASFIPESCYPISIIPPRSQ